MARTTNNTTKHKGVSYSRFGYFFIAPFVIAYSIFSLFPLLTTFWYSISDMGSLTAEFWGFGNKEVYYDRYLDLDAQEVDLSAAGVNPDDYDLIRAFFKIQDQTDKIDPTEEEGMQAIIDNGANDYISQDTINKIQQCIDDKSMVPLYSDDGTAVAELTAFHENYSDATQDAVSQLSAINSTLTGIVDTATSDAEAAAEATEETETVTGETILASDDYTEFVASLDSLELEDPNTQLVIDYLTTYTGASSLKAYFESVESVEDPMFYYVVSRLVTPNAYMADGTEIAGIDVPFASDVETYLTDNSWSDTINGNTSYSQLASYASGEIDISEDQGTLSADLQALNDAGIISVVALTEQNGALAASEDASNNIVKALADIAAAGPRTDAEVNASKADIHISSLIQYDKNIADKMSDIKAATGKSALDYITFDGDFDVDKYIEFKTIVGLNDTMTMDWYNELDQTVKEQNTEKYTQALADAQEQLADPDLSDLKKASLEGTVMSATAYLEDPTGILAKVDKTSMYLVNGLDNFASIFGQETRFHKVLGAFISTAVMWVIGFIPQILLALLLSAWFTDTKIHLKGLGLMKGLMYLPNVITAATIAIFFGRLFTYSTGGAQSVAQIVLHAFGHESYNFFASTTAKRCIVAFINFWMWYGNTMIVFIAGITSINESLYEAAQVDGANTSQTYLQITLPLLRPIMLYTMVTSLIGGLQMYDIPANLFPKVNPTFKIGNTSVGGIDTILMYINTQAFKVQQVGVASAVAVILFIVTTILSILIFYLMRDKDASKAKKLAKKGGVK